MVSSCSVTKSIVLLFARIFFSAIFVISGLNKVINFTATAQMMTQAGIPASELIAVLAIIFELGGGLLIFFGWYARFGALLIFLFIIPVTYVFHSYWGYEGAEMVNNMAHFFKNLAMWGGALYIMACGAGHISIDGFVRKKCCQTKKHETSS